MKLVDTSSWAHQIRRRGDPSVRARVEQLLRTGEAAWRPIVRLELWAGVGSEADRALLRDYQKRLPELDLRACAKISLHSGASAGRADARRRDAGDVVHRRGAATPQMPARRRAP